MRKRHRERETEIEIEREDSASVQSLIPNRRHKTEPYVIRK